jgi:citrate synthase
MHPETTEITELIEKVAKKARKETGSVSSPEFTGPIEWPVECTVGPGLEGAIACESSIGYVDGTRGRLIYRGYDIFDLCAYSTFEEVSYLLLHGELPNKTQLQLFKDKLIEYRRMPKTLRMIMSFPVEEMNAMAALRMATNLMRQEFTYADKEESGFDERNMISADEDSIPMETMPKGEEKAIYEFKKRPKRRPAGSDALEPAAGWQPCYHLISGVATLAAAIARLRRGLMPLEPDPELGHAANLLYMITGERPTPTEARIMDVALILHADHGMNASTFASMVTASTLSDFYLSAGSGIAALNGPLHGGANEQVLYTLQEIGSEENVQEWYKAAREEKRKIMGFGHRVYKAYDPRARVLGPLAEHMAGENEAAQQLLKIATSLEQEVVRDLGEKKGIWPNVDFYSGIVYSCMGIPAELFTPIFAVSRMAGWTARILEYLEKNRIFRPRAIYVGELERDFTPLPKRQSRKKSIPKGD